MASDRYLRHSLIDWFSQEKVNSAKIAVVGCGAVGNEVAKNLALIGVGHLDLYDFDTIEIHNLTRSVLFRERDVGKSKATIAAERVSELDPNISVTAHSADFWDVMTFDSVRSYNCIICCVDNFEARIRLNQLCLIAGRPLINTGIDSKHAQIEIFPFGTGANVSCYECNLPSTVYGRIQERYSCGWLKKVAFAEKKIPTTIVTSSLSGSLAVSYAMKILHSQEMQKSKRIFIDSSTGVSSVSDFHRSDSCLACSPIKHDVVLLKSHPLVSGSFCSEVSGIADTCIASEPILVTLRCVNCQPEESQEEVVFERALDHNSSIRRCSTCNSETVDVTIKDAFNLSEIKSKYAGRKMPCKYLKFETKDKTLIVEMEN